jgi:hypothetical protein
MRGSWGLVVSHMIDRVDEWVVWFKRPWGIRERLREWMVIITDFL